jgi:hypothetical protein
MFGSERWTPTKCDETKIKLFERKILQEMCGPINEYGTWQIRHNHELYQLYAEPRIIERVTAKRLRLLPHLSRANEENPCKRITFTKIEWEDPPPLKK